MNCSWLADLWQALIVGLFVGGAGIAASAKKLKDASDGVRRALSEHNDMAKILNDIGGGDGPDAN